jgi:hypothetical protein
VREHPPVVNHTIAGIDVALTGDFALPEELRHLLARCDDPSEITVRLTAARGASGLRPDGPPTMETDSWVSFVDERELRICIKDAGRTPAEVARIDLARDGLDGRYVYDRDWPYLFQYPTDQLLVTHALGIGGGALIHAAAITGRDGALLVAGPSGAGKTTISRAAAALGAHVLSDERITVRPSAAHGGWVVGGTPWPGDGGFIENRSVPLKAIILLEQADDDELVPLSPARVLALLYRCHFLPVWDPRACERTIDNLERLVRERPAFLYRNKKGPAAAARLLEFVGGAA